MKSTAVLLVFLCVPLISAFEVDFFAHGTKANIFAPIPEAAKDLMFTEFLPYVREILNKTKKIDWPDRRQFLLGLLHSHNSTDLNPLNLNLRNQSITEKTDFTYNIQRLINVVNDGEILFKYGININERVDHIDNNVLSAEDPIHAEFDYYANVVTSKHKIHRVLDENVLHLIHVSYGSSDRKEFLKIILDIIQANSCNKLQSQQQIISNLMGHLKLVDVQWYMSMMFCDSMYRRVVVNTTKLLYDFYLNEIPERRLSYYNKTIDIISEMSLEVKRCDPRNHIEDVTYITLAGPFKYNSKWGTSFYAKPCFSNVYNNSVVTGVRLVQKSNVVYIQIQEGQLLANGYINTSSINWTPIKEENCESTECNFFQWKGTLSVDLNNVFVPKDPDNVLTGIAFEHRNGRLGLTVYSTPFNFTTGKLYTDGLQHPWNATTFVPSRTELKLPSHNSPILSKKKNLSSLNNDQFLTFTTTKSAVVIPYIDIQPVQTIPASPMSGASFDYRGNDESGGFLALKLFTYNITSHVKL